MEHSRWKKLMNTFGIPENIKTYNVLVNAYSERHRFYHNTTHITATLKHLDSVSRLARHPEEIELALWFHDAIYKPFSNINELDSANWSSEFLQVNSVAQNIIKRVHNLILATQHSVALTEHDEKLLVDIDLSILGCSESEYKQFEINIRKEYQKVPLIIFKKKRKQILLSFLNRERIYNNDYFFNKLEKQARINIENAIINL